MKRIVIAMMCALMLVGCAKETEETEDLSFLENTDWSTDYYAPMMGFVTGNYYQHYEFWEHRQVHEYWTDRNDKRTTWDRGEGRYMLEREDYGKYKYKLTITIGTEQTVFRMSSKHSFVDMDNEDIVYYESK